MLRSMIHAWNDPVTRWELRFLESQHRPPRRWWLALIALPGITAAVLFARYLDPESSVDGSVISYWLISAMLLAYMIGAWVTVSLSAAALAKRDPSVMGEHLILTSVTAKRLAFARVIALWRHHRRLWLLLLVLRGALAYGTMVTLIWYPLYNIPSVQAFYYIAVWRPMYYAMIDLEPETGGCSNPTGRCLGGWLFKGDWRAWYATPPAAAAATPIGVLILTAADSFLVCAGAALVSRVFYRLPALVVGASSASRLLIAVLAFGVMDNVPRVRDDLNRMLSSTLASAGTAVHWRRIRQYDANMQVIFQLGGFIGKTPRELLLFRHLLDHYTTESGSKSPHRVPAVYTQRVIVDGLQLSASGLIDGAYPIANMIRPEDSARYVVFAMFTVAGSAVLYLILIGAQMRIALWIVQRRGVLR